MRIVARNLGLGLIAVCAAVLVFAPTTVAQESKEKKTAIPNCPVMGKEVNFFIKSDTASGPVYFCCKGCVGKYEKEPDKYVAKVADQRLALAKMKKVQVGCPFSGEPIKKDVFAEHNGEKVYFCCNNCAGKFKKNPAEHQAKLAGAYTYQTICPVMNKPIDPEVSTKLPTGETVYLCCKRCRGRFSEDPSKFGKSLATQGFSANWEKVNEILDKRPRG